MDVLINLLLWVHIVAFVAGGSNSVVMPVLGQRLATAGPDTRGAIFATADTLAQIGKFAMATLLVTGPLIIWLKYGGLGSANAWFWIKMALIVVMLASIIYGGINFKKAQSGDAGAAAKARQAGMVTGLAFLGVMLAAVFAFN